MDRQRRHGHRTWIRLRGRKAELRKTLGDDLSVIDDPHPVGQYVRFPGVLGGEEHGGTVVAGQPGHLIP